MRLLKPFFAGLFTIVLAGCGGGEGWNDFDDVLVSSPGRGVCGVATGFSAVYGNVQGVIDGDTLVLQVGSKVERVRLLGIDAPESDQEYGEQSARALAYSVLGRDVIVGTEKYDVYGRMLGLVFRSDCSLVNLDLVESGYAWFYKQYANDLPSYQMAYTFESAQAMAMLRRIGLWASNFPIEPWVFRRQ